MKESIVYKSILASLILIGSCFAVPNRDGCVQMSDKCICSNTGNKGFCFPGSHSISGELYCNCQADTYSPYEIGYKWYEKFVLASPEKRAEVTKMYLNDIMTFALIGGVITADLGIPGWPDPRETGQDLVPAYENFVRVMKAKPILGAFFRLSDGCQYINQPCRCSNSGAKGVCGMNYPKNGKVFRQDDLYCHCD